MDIDKFLLVMNDPNKKEQQKQIKIKKSIHRRKNILAVAAALTIILVYQGGLLTDADALTRYYNCTTRVANSNGTLSLQNVDNCYDKVFKGAKEAEKEAQALRVGSVENQSPN